MNAKIIQKAHKAKHRHPFVQQRQIKAKHSLDEPGAIRSKQLLPTIESIATGTPNNVVRQSDAAKFVANLPILEQNRFRIDKLYSNTRIDTRHLAVNLLSDDAIAHMDDSNLQGQLTQPIYRNCWQVIERRILPRLRHA